MSNRVVVWFSCGATSAVAAKLALKKYGADRVKVVYCDTNSEHESNKKFLVDVQNWLGVPIEILRSEKYKDIWDVFEKTRWLNGVKGARCTIELKKTLRLAYQRPDDIQVFGYDIDEKDRAERFKEQNPEVVLDTVLITTGLSKGNCLQILKNAGIELPVMYQLGYGHNNCVGCVKGQAGYWNKIRIDFPDIFSRMALLERSLNVALNKSYAGDGKRKRIFLDDLDPKAGRYEEEPKMSCDILCGAIENELGGTDKQGIVKGAGESENKISDKTHEGC